MRAAGIVALRPEAAADATFVARLYASTRAAELAPFDLSDAQLAAFLAQQHAAERERERSRHRGGGGGQRAGGRADGGGAAAAAELVLVDDEPVGRLVVARTRGLTRLLDFALLPAWRGGGIGTQLLRALCAEADAAGLPLAVELAGGSAALPLFARHGFVPHGTTAVQIELRRPPAGVDGSVRR